MTRNLIILGCAVLLAITMSSFSTFAGSLPDGDGDGVPDSFDNCNVDNNGPLLPDANNCLQTDADTDGYGNACDADVVNNGAIDLVDLGAILTGLGGTDPLLDISCNSAVDLVDLGIVLAELGGIPGPSGLACAGSVPCP